MGSKRITIRSAPSVYGSPNAGESRPSNRMAGAHERGWTQPEQQPMPALINPPGEFLPVAPRKIGVGERFLRTGAAVGTALAGAAGGFAALPTPGAEAATQPFIGPVLSESWQAKVGSLELRDFALQSAGPRFPGSREVEVVLAVNAVGLNSANCNVGVLRDVTRGMLVDGRKVGGELGMALVDQDIGIDEIRLDVGQMAQASYLTEGALRNPAECVRAAEGQKLTFTITAHSPADADKIPGALETHWQTVIQAAGLGR